MVWLLVLAERNPLIREFTWYRFMSPQYFHVYASLIFEARGLTYIWHYYQLFALKMVSWFKAVYSKQNKAGPILIPPQTKLVILLVLVCIKVIYIPPSLTYSLTKYDLWHLPILLLFNYLSCYVWLLCV